MTRAGEIEKQAVSWIIRRDAIASVTEQAALQQEFKAWIDADVRHRAAYVRLNAAWERSQIAERLKPLAGPVNRDLLAPATRLRFAGALRWAMAATVVLALGAGTAWLVTQPSTQKYATEVGSFERIRLDDGSTLELNTASVVRVRFGKRERIVELDRGEARFIVARDTARPFTVKAGGSSVRAIGTAFTVRLRDKRRIDVLVTEGRVRLEDPAVAPRALSAGEAAIVQAGRIDVTSVEPARVSRQLAWTQGKLVFNEEPLPSAIAEFNRYNTRQLVVADPALLSVRVGGTFEATDPVSFLAALRRVYGQRAQEGVTLAD